MEQFLRQNLRILIASLLWAVSWKGWALWRAAKLDDKKWFIALLVIQTLAILDILYLYVLRNKRRVWAEFQKME